MMHVPRHSNGILMFDSSHLVIHRIKADFAFNQCDCQIYSHWRPWVAPSPWCNPLGTWIRIGKNSCAKPMQRCRGPFSGFKLHHIIFFCVERQVSSLQYQISGVNYTAFTISGCCKCTVMVLALLFFAKWYRYITLLLGSSANHDVTFHVIVFIRTSIIQTYLLLFNNKLHNLNHVIK